MEQVEELLRRGGLARVGEEAAVVQEVFGDFRQARAGDADVPYAGGQAEAVDELLNEVRRVLRGRRPALYGGGDEGQAVLGPGQVPAHDVGQGDAGGHAVGHVEAAAQAVADGVAEAQAGVVHAPDGEPGRDLTLGLGLHVFRVFVALRQVVEEQRNGGQRCGVRHGLMADGAQHLDGVVQGLDAGGAPELVGRLDDQGWVEDDDPGGQALVHDAVLAAGRLVGDAGAVVELACRQRSGDEDVGRRDVLQRRNDGRVGVLVLRAVAVELLAGGDALAEHEADGLRRVRRRATTEADDEVGLGRPRRGGGVDDVLGRRVSVDAGEGAGVTRAEGLLDAAQDAGLGGDAVAGDDEGARAAQAIHLRRQGGEGVLAEDDGLDGERTVLALDGGHGASFLVLAVVRRTVYREVRGVLESYLSAKTGTFTYTCHARDVVRKSCISGRLSRFIAISWPKR